MIRTHTTLFGKCKVLEYMGSQPAITQPYQLALASEGLNEVDDVLLPQHPQHLDLPQRSLAHNFILCVTSIGQ